MIWITTIYPDFVSHEGLHAEGPIVAAIDVSDGPMPPYVRIKIAMDPADVDAVLARVREILESREAEPRWTITSGRVIEDDGQAQ